MSEKRFQIVLDNSRFIKQIEEANVAFDKLANKINKARSATAQGGLAGGIKEASQEGDKLNSRPLKSVVKREVIRGWLLA